MNLLGLPSTALQKKGLAVRLMAFIYGFMKDTYNCLFSRKNLNNSSLSTKVVFFYSSLNEKRALENVASCVNNATTISTQIGEPNKINYFIPYLLAIAYTPWVFFKYFNSVGYKKRSFSYALDQYLFACGYIVYLRFVLSRNRPSLAVVSNDHTMQSRSFALVCRELNVPVAYIQHASVSEKFPKLMFDYAFLDGIDALEKYEIKGLEQCVIFLSGISKLDDAIYKLKQTTKQRNIISICPNSMDELEAVVTVAKYIKEFVDQRFNVCLRPHPGDKRRFDFWREKAMQIGVLYSEPELECSSDLIIKSIVVVAADLKAIPICIPFTGKILDHYGFIRRGVVLYAENSIELVSSINNAPKWKSFYQASKHFSHVVGTKNEGSSAELIAQTLNALADTKNIPDVWHLYAKSVFEAT
jgi:hypothetical protein